MKPTEKGQRVRPSNSTYNHLYGDSAIGTVIWIGPLRRVRGTSFRKIGIKLDRNEKIAWGFRTDYEVVE